MGVWAGSKARVERKNHVVVIRQQILIGIIMVPENQNEQAR